MTANRLPDAYLSITDFGLGILPGGSAGITAKVGVSSKGRVNQIAMLTDSDQIVETFGSGILVDSLGDSFSGGSKQVYAVRAAGDIDGTVGAVVKAAASESDTGTVTVTGKPLDAYNVKAEIVSGGEKNEATFRYALEDTGLSLSFTGTYVAGTVFTFATTAPQASMASIIAAVKVLLDSALAFECVHVCGESDQALWTAMDVLMQQAESDFRYSYCCCDAPYMNAGETVDEWVQRIIAMRANFASTRVQVHAAFGTVTDMLTGKQAVRNLGGIIRGYVCGLKRQQSPGAVELGSLPGVVNIQPEGLNNAHVLALDNAGFTTVRKFIGMNGTYVTNGRMMAENGSDYEQEENRRVMDHSCELVRSQALKKVKAEATEDGQKVLEAFLSHALAVQIGDKEIVSGTVVIPEGQDVYATSRLRVKIRIVPVPIMREIEIDIGLENPFLLAA